MISIFMALIFVIGGFPMAYASASYGFNDYQQSVLEFSNKYHDGTNLVLDARLCAMAAMLAVEQDGRSKMTAYRPNGQKWDTISRIMDILRCKHHRAATGCAQKQSRRQNKLWNTG